MRPEVMLLLCVAYFLSRPFLAAAREALGISGKSESFIHAVAAHNLGLALFSGYVFVNSWPIVLSHYSKFGFEAIYCDNDGFLWSEAGIGGWAVIFYVSKYYEFVDTWILVLKGKKPSFLQTYHHIGIVMTMWGAVSSFSSWVLVVVLLNSGIHTIMYTYFFIKTLEPKRHIPAAKYLTSAQIVQFFIGVFYTIGVHGKPCRYSQASRFSAFLMQFYGVGLILLFLSFFANKYEKKQA